MREKAKSSDQESEVGINGKMGEQEKEKENGKGKKRKICKGWALEGKAEAQEDGRREGYDRNRIGIE